MPNALRRTVKATIPVRIIVPKRGVLSIIPEKGVAIHPIIDVTPVTVTTCVIL